MLKTSGSIESITRSKKGKVGIGGNGGNNNSLNNGGCNGDSDRNLLDAPKSMYSPVLLTLILRTSSSTDSSISATQITVKYNEVSNDSSKLVKKLSKS